MPRPSSSGSGFSTVSRVSPTQQVQNQLLAAIERGEFPPGGKLPSERVLCETFGVSRVSVREALAGLTATGLIEVSQGRGAFVRQRVSEGYLGPFGKYIETHRDELAELLMVRGALDGLAAATAAQTIDDEGRAALQAAHEAFARAVEQEASPPELAELDVDFHQRIAAAAHGELLPKLIAQLHSLLVESRHILFSRAGQPSRSLADHQEILDAILSGDHDTAKELATRHAAKMQDWAEQEFPKAG